jgi:hypothetical protein
MPNPLRPNRNPDALKQLNNALAELQSANTILDSVAATWTVPDAPDQPPFISTLTSIKAQAGHSIEVATRLLNTMGV